MAKGKRICKTNRGFLRADFLDYNGQPCSIQESSLATNYCLWLGSNEGTHHMGQCLARMHLDRKMAAWLWPLVKRFAETGLLSQPKAEARRRNREGGR